MMKPSMMLVLAGMVLPICDLSAQAPGTDFDRLKLGYDAAVQRATASLRETYRKELEKLLLKAEKAAQLDEALRIREELNKTGAPPEAAKSSTEPADAAAPKGIERYFVGKAWASAGGTKFSFQKNGTGRREYGVGKSSFVWKQYGPDIVEATGPKAPGEPDSKWYFRFASSEEAFYGDNPEAISVKLKLSHP